MQKIDIYDQYKNTKDSKTMFCFKGMISAPLLLELGELVKKFLESHSKLRKIFAVFIELAQNIYYYSEEKMFDVHTGKDGGSGIITLIDQDNKFYLKSGNLILNQNIEKVKNKFDYVNSLSKEELKVLYQQEIKKERPVDSKGAGLGFIDISRKCDSKIIYEIDKIDDKFSFLIISVFFNKED